MTRDNVLYLVISVLVVAVVTLGYQLYEAKKDPKGIQLNIVQELLGHAQMTTTAIYAHAVGAERRSIVARLWEA